MIEPKEQQTDLILFPKMSLTKGFKGEPPEMDFKNAENPVELSPCQ